MVVSLVDLILVLNMSPVISHLVVTITIIIFVAALRMKNKMFDEIKTKRYSYCRIRCMYFVIDSSNLFVYSSDGRTNTTKISIGGVKEIK